MPVKIQRALSITEARHKARCWFVAIVSAGRQGRKFVPFAGEACLTKTFLQQVRTRSIISSRRIFRGLADEISQQRGHIVFSRDQTCKQAMSHGRTTAVGGSND